MRDDATARAVASLPARLRGRGLKSAVRTSQAAYVASWADVLKVLGAKVPDLGRDIAQAVGEERTGNGACLQEAAAAPATLRAGVWKRSCHGSRCVGDSDRCRPQETRRCRRGDAWVAIRYVNSTCYSSISPQRPMRPAGPCSCPSPVRRRVDGSRPCQPAPARPSNTFGCKFLSGVACGGLCRRAVGDVSDDRAKSRLDVLGDHMASCHLSGRLSRRAKPLERTWARLLRDTTLHHIRPTDGRRLENVATGLPLHRGAPLGCDATIMSPLHADGTP